MNVSLPLRLVAAVVAAAPLLALSSSSAPASSLGCTWAPGSYASYVCVAISGSGRYVSSVRVTRNKQYSSICNYKAKFVVTSPSGLRKWRFYSPYHSGCSWNTAWMDIAVYRSFPDGSTACGHWYEMGRWLPAVPCETIHA
jgi:hypothetical protein